MKTIVRVTGFITFSVLAFLAALFYLERTLTFDLAFQDMHLILNKSFFLNIRVGSAVPQIPPLILRLFDMPLQYILLSHSVSFIVFNFIIFLLITYWLKEHAVALAFVLFQVLVVNDSFYWTPPEFQQGLAYTFLYYAYLEQKGVLHIRQRPILHFVFLLFIQTFHPLLFIPLAFIILYKLYKDVQLEIPKYIIPVALLGGVTLIRFVISVFDTYERSRINLFKAIYTHLSSIFSLPSVQLMAQEATGDYLVYWILFILTVAMLLKQKEYALTALLGLFTIGHWIIICVGRPTGEKFYLEYSLLPLSIFLLLPFIDFVLKKIEHMRYAFAIILFAIITVRFISLYQTHTPYTNRLTWYKAKFDEMDKQQTQRLMLREKDVPMDTLLASWASGYESIFLSAIENPEHVKSIVIDDSLEQFNYMIESDTTIVAQWASWSINQLPANYFKFKPGRYLIPQED